MDFDAEIVLGGEGFIGKYLVGELRSQGAHVLVYDLKNGYDLRLSPPPLNHRNSYVWFLAWDVGGAQYLMNKQNQINILRNNLLLCQTVFPWIAEHDLPSTFVGTQMAGYPNAYGITKLVGEYWAKLTPRCIVSRFWNVYGLEDSSERSHVVTDLVRSGLDGHVSCLTSGSERRQFLYVKDCVDGLLHQRKIGQGIADISSGVWTPIRQVVETIAREIRTPAQFGDECGYESIVEPTMPLAGWSPRYSLIDGIRDMLKEIDK